MAEAGQPSSSADNRWVTYAMAAGIVALFVALWWPVSGVPQPANDRPLVNLEPPVHDDSFVEGVALGMYFEEDGRHYEGYLWEIANTGADSVSLIVTWQQDTVSSTEVRRDPGQTPDDDDLRRTIRAAHALGLDVTLFPILWLQHREPGDWRGVLEPESLEAWFESYGAFITHYADLAEEEGVEILSVGSELASMEEHVENWRQLIEEVRDRFGGELLYSANWDHYAETPFWAELDYIGVTGYYELTRIDGYSPTRSELVSAWQPIIAELTTVSEALDRPLILTEVGYVSQPYAARHPWDYTADAPVDLLAQLTLYEALFLAWRDEPALGGLYFWNWFGDGGASDNGYCPRNKPAEQVIRHWYGSAE